MRAIGRSPISWGPGLEGFRKFVTGVGGGEADVVGVPFMVDGGGVGVGVGDDLNFWGSVSATRVEGEAGDATTSVLTLNSILTSRFMARPVERENEGKGVASTSSTVGGGDKSETCLLGTDGLRLWLCFATERILVIIASLQWMAQRCQSGEGLT